MEKLFFGTITVLILMAFISIQLAPFTVANITPVTTITNDAEDPQALLIWLVETEQLNSSELTFAENIETVNEVTEIKQETGDNERGVFISIGSLVLIGILLLLPPIKKV